MKRIRKTRKTNMTMANKEAEAGAAKINRKQTMSLVVEEAKAMVVVEEAVAVVEVTKETTPSTIMEKETVAASMEAEEAAKGIMDTIITSTRGTNNILSHISNNKCL